MNIRTAGPGDLPFLLENDRHPRFSALEAAVGDGRILLAEDSAGQPVGWLRWNLFWDEIPFINMLFVLDGKRGGGAGSRLVSEWEAAMRAEGYSLVMTSTLSNETAQHFYRKLGYTDAGGLLLEGEPLELVLVKKL